LADTHVSLNAQALPQPPQWSLLVAVSTQLPPQSILPQSHICPEPVLAAEEDALADEALGVPPLPPDPFPPVEAEPPPPADPVLAVDESTHSPLAQIRSPLQSMSLVQPPSSEEQAASRAKGASATAASASGAKPRRPRRA